MATPAKPLFRQRFCRAPACRVRFFICSYCYRGQVYCSESCRQPARREQRRQANRRHQQTLRGRLAHSRRQHTYRRRLTPAHYQRRENKVTDHSSQAQLRVRPSRRVASPYLPATNLAPLPSPSGLVVCRFCGRPGRFLKRD
jgi:hypothetical protein